MHTRNHHPQRKSAERGRGVGQKADIPGVREVEYINYYLSFLNAEKGLEKRGGSSKVPHDFADVFHG